MILSFVLAVSENYGIGLNNELPWAFNKLDMAWFKKNTLDKPIVMGSSTWYSLPFKPLPRRTNVVLTTRGAILGADLIMSGNPIKELKELFPDQEVCVIGGAKVYEQLWPYVDRIYLTRILQTVEADTFFKIDEMFNSDIMNDRAWVCSSSETPLDANLIFEIWNCK